MFDARDGDLDREVKRAVIMSIGKPLPRRRPRLTLRLALLLILLGLTALLGLASLAGATGVERPVGKPVQKGPGGRGAGQVTPSEKLSGNFGPSDPALSSSVGHQKFPGNSGPSARESLYNFLQFASPRRAGPEAAHQAQENHPLQLFPVASEPESALSPEKPANVFVLLGALSFLLWIALVGTIRSRRPW